MKITVFGATGMVGKELVRQSLVRGHTIVAFGRNVFTAPFPENEKLNLFKGALFDENEVWQAVRDSDAVLSAIGGSIDGSDRARSMGMENIVRQMKKAGTRRIIAVGGMGVLDNKEGKLLLRQPGYPAQFLAVGEEHLKALNTLKESGLDWTFVCCPDILPGDAAGLYQITADTTPEPNSYRIQASDLASFMLEELEKGNFIRKRVGICN
jgi:hypothetical protein